jgi:hypothetical protein
MTSAIEQMQAERQPKSDKIIRYPVRKERLYGTG